jgi:nucleoside-diphosphate-sugar epimerase
MISPIDEGHFEVGTILTRREDVALNEAQIFVKNILQALRKQPMTVYGDGKQTRSFQYVSDLVCDAPI